MTSPTAGTGLSAVGSTDTNNAGPIWSFWIVKPAGSLVGLPICGLIYVTTTSRICRDSPVPSAVARATAMPSVSIASGIAASIVGASIAASIVGASIAASIVGASI